MMETSCEAPAGTKRVLPMPWAIQHGMQRALHPSWRQEQEHQRLTRCLQVLQTPPVLWLCSRPQRWLHSVPARSWILPWGCSVPRPYRGAGSGAEPWLGAFSPHETLLFFTKGNKTSAVTRCVSVVSAGSAPCPSLPPPQCSSATASREASGWGSGRAPGASVDGHRVVLGCPSGRHGQLDLGFG